MRFGAIDLCKCGGRQRYLVKSDQLRSFVYLKGRAYIYVFYGSYVNTAALLAS